jgi:hypothetical protein
MPSAAKSSPRRRGRPPLHAGETKRAAFGTRLRPALKERIEQEASRNGRSLSEEIEYRLENSDRDRELLLQGVYDSFGGYDNYRVMQLIAGAIIQVEQTTGRRWREDLETYAEVKEAVEFILYAVTGKARNFPFPLAIVVGSPHKGLGRRAALDQLKEHLERLALTFALVGDQSGPKRASAACEPAED